METKIQSSEKKLLKNTFIYMIGTMTSKLLQFFILPIVTAILMTNEYGYYDLIISASGIIIPIITMQSTEGLFRFVFNANPNERSVIISSVSIFLLVSMAIFSLIFSIFQCVTKLMDFSGLVLLYFITFTIYTYYQKLCRCLQKNVVFAVSGVIHTFVLLGVECILLIILKMRVDGLLWANIVSNIVCIVYLEIHTQSTKIFDIKKLSKGYLLKILKYSLPLVPNSISWWFISACNRYIIAFFIGVGANGIYSVAGKFPQLVTFVVSIFQTAWQESAVMEADSEKRDEFYTNVFNQYMNVLLSATVIIIPVLKIVVPVMIADTYLDGMRYIPVLMISSVMTAFSQFYGTAYMVFQKTQKAFSTSIVAAFINLTISIGLINKIGLFAPAIGTACAFCIQWIIRIKQMKECFKVKIYYKKLMILIGMLAVCIIEYYFVISLVTTYLIILLGVIIFFVNNKELIIALYNKIFKNYSF